MRSLQQSVGEWGEATFPHSTLESIHAHIVEEIGELSEALAVGNPESIAEECADIALMLLHIAYRTGFNLDDAMRDKFAVVRGRQWDSGSERGYSRHIEEATP